MDSFLECTLYKSKVESWEAAFVIPITDLQERLTLGLWRDAFGTLYTFLQRLGHSCVDLSTLDALEGM